MDSYDVLEMIEKLQKSNNNEVLYLVFEDGSEKEFNNLQEIKDYFIEDEQNIIDHEIKELKNLNLKINRSKNEKIY